LPRHYSGDMVGDTENSGQSFDKGKCRETYEGTSSENANDYLTNNERSGRYIVTETSASSAANNNRILMLVVVIILKDLLVMLLIKKK